MDRLVFLGESYILDHVQITSVMNLSERSQFNCIVLRKTISKLLHTLEEGLFMVRAMVVGCFQVDKYWYALCDYRRLLNQKNGLHLYGHCNYTTYNQSYN